MLSKITGKIKEKLPPYEHELVAACSALLAALPKCQECGAYASYIGEGKPRCLDHFVSPKKGWRFRPSFDFATEAAALEAVVETRRKAPPPPFLPTRRDEPLREKARNLVSKIPRCRCGKPAATLLFGAFFCEGHGKTAMPDRLPIFYARLDLPYESVVTILEKEAP